MVLPPSIDCNLFFRKNEGMDMSQQKKQVITIRDIISHIGKLKKESEFLKGYSKKINTARLAYARKEK